jgi:hypothetical protein
MGIRTHSLLRNSKRSKKPEEQGTLNFNNQERDKTTGGEVACLIEAEGGVASNIEVDEVDEMECLSERIETEDINNLRKEEFITEMIMTINKDMREGALEEEHSDLM